MGECLESRANYGSTLATFTSCSLDSHPSSRVIIPASGPRVRELQDDCLATCRRTQGYDSRPCEEQQPLLTHASPVLPESSCESDIVYHINVQPTRKSHASRDMPELHAPCSLSCTATSSATTSIPSNDDKKVGSGEGARTGPSGTLMLEEETVYPPVSALFRQCPPTAVQGTSGWVYHSTTISCLRPAHPPRLIAILIIESSFFDPFILLTIMCVYAAILITSLIYCISDLSIAYLTTCLRCNCVTMAWASPLDPPGTPKEVTGRAPTWYTTPPLAPFLSPSFRSEACTRSRLSHGPAVTVPPCCP